MDFKISGSSDLHPPKKHHQTLSLNLAQRKEPRAEREFNQYTATTLETFNNSAPTTARRSLQLTHGHPVGGGKGIEEVAEVGVATAATFRESCTWAGSFGGTLHYEISFNPHNKRVQEGTIIANSQMRIRRRLGDLSGVT